MSRCFPQFGSHSNDDNILVHGPTLLLRSRILAKLGQRDRETAIVCNRDLVPCYACTRGLRNRHGLAINSFVHDKRTQHFLWGHVEEVANLIRLVNEHYSGGVSICATGRLSERSKSFISALQTESGVSVGFDGIWVSGEDAVFADINLVARQIARTGVGRRAERRGAPNRLAWLRDVRWSRQTSWTYAKVAHAGEKEAVVQDLREMANFAKEDGKELLEMNSANTLRRAL
ncbi:hypothetical protein P171DRAFT_431051 [Karstenula rhodostoma CBS 690.94]|uniref:Uncharacterized protein n=1 Tax=Karstenula rhodostoma CBS 690.94 TaxID=1392251 RepID=A0A9P4PIG0_9PLEO|nr:hypothetical protein P171DRAFT_431051 [Karstenula rhodostoma CBS 690.94]